jgi:hypothetical protein
MNVDRFFVECLDELESRATWESSEYSLLRAAALLRLLLVDGLPLVTEVNRARRLPETYAVRRAPMDTQPGTWWLGGLDPDHPAEGQIEVLDRKNLLQVPLLDLVQERLTIRDLIQLAANVRGGVHRGKPETRKHQFMESYPLKLQLGDTPLELYALVSVATVVLKGLQPLRAAARRDMPPDLPPEPDGGRRVTARYAPGLVPEAAGRKNPADGIGVRVSFTPPLDQT